MTDKKDSQGNFEKVSSNVESLRCPVESCGLYLRLAGVYCTGDPIYECRLHGIIDIKQLEIICKHASDPTNGGEKKRIS